MNTSQWRARHEYYGNQKGKAKFAQAVEFEIAVRIKDSQKD